MSLVGIGNTYLFNTWTDHGKFIILSHCGITGTHDLIITKSHVDSIYIGRHIAWWKIIIGISLLIVCLTSLQRNVTMISGVIGFIMLGVAIYQLILRSITIYTNNGSFVKQWCCDENDAERLKTSIYDECTSQTQLFENQ
jgi:hypothetical protein